MRTFKNITVLMILTLTTVFCVARFGQRKPASVCDKCGQATAATITDTEDFSLVSLLTLKFM